MYGRKVKLRFFFIFLAIVTLALSIFLILKSLEENVVYFKSPSEIKIDAEIDRKKMRVGGMVKKNSIKIESQDVKFVITDFKNEINVSFKGTIPNLFAEGKGVVAEGKLQDKKFFVADRILAKHDENYMPPELKNIMKDNAK
jgi:cytochrome c-type biogenesis protein CcmE